MRYFFLISHCARFRWYPRAPFSGTDRVDTFPPGTGPFVFKEWRKLGHVTFARNKDYWQKNIPYLDEVTIKIAEEPSVRFTALRAGDLDMIERTPYPHVVKVQNGSVRGVKATPAPFGGFRRIIFNVVEAPFNNPKLRQAVAYAIDRKQFVQGGFWGYGQPTQQRFPQGIPGISNCRSASATRRWCRRSSRKPA